MGNRQNLKKAETKESFLIKPLFIKRNSFCIHIEKVL